MEGDLKLNPGTPLRTGFIFSLPGNKLPFTALVSKATVVFQLRCVSGAPASPSTLTVAIANQLYPVAGANWIPTADAKSPLTYQGSAPIPNACAGGKVRLDKGGTFSAVIRLF
jgi:hypothetical protein